MKAYAQTLAMLKEFQETHPDVPWWPPIARKLRSASPLTKHETSLQT